MAPNHRTTFFYIVVSLLAVTSNAVAADETLNPRWVGTWQTSGEPQTITITPQTLTVGQYKYKWTGNMAGEKKGCYFSYVARSSKADMLKAQDGMRKAAIDPARDKVSRAELSKFVTTTENVLKELSPGNYKLIGTACLPDEGGDGAFCSPTYLLDKDALYESGSCVGDSDSSFYLKRYLKR